MDEDVARELAALKARCDELEADRQKTAGLVQMMAQALGESITLQAICTVLLAEIARIDPDPRSKLGAMTAALLGLAEGVAKGAGQDATRLTAPMSVVVDRVTALAEVLLQSPR